MRLASIVTPAVSGNAQSLALTYDSASNVKTVTDTAVTPTETVTYYYDQLNRLNTMRRNIGNGNLAVAGYIYDQIGNMTSKTELGSNGMLNGMGATLIYPATGQAHPHAVTSTTGTPALTLTYDTNGNLATQGTSTYAFDAENRLKSRTISGGQMTYTYDAQGTLIKRTNTATGGWTAYVGGIYEKNSDGSLVKYYQAYGRAIAMRLVPSGGGSGTLSYLLSDHLGSATAITDTTGAVVSSQKYWPYGSPRLQTGTLATDKQFTAQQVEAGDSALGLYNYKARFYSTVLGRFASADTSTRDGLNRYSYARNNPLRYNDPTGLDAASDLTGLAWAFALFSSWGGTHQQFMDALQQGLGDIQGPPTMDAGPHGYGSCDVDGENGCIEGPRCSESAGCPNDSTDSTSPLDPKALLVGALAVEGESVVATGGADASVVAPAVVLTGATLGGIVLGQKIGNAIANTFFAKRGGYQVPPQTLPGFPGALRVPPKAGRARWMNPDGKILEWDSQHGAVEKYSPRGKHEGEYDKDTGEQIEPPVPGRTTPP